MKAIKSDIDIDYIVKHNRKFPNNHEVKAANVDNIIKPENVKAMLKLAIQSKKRGK